MSEHKPITLIEKIFGHRVSYQELLKSRMLSFAETHTTKWQVILKNASGDRETAIKLLSYYFNLMDYWREVLTRDYSKNYYAGHKLFTVVLAHAERYDWNLNGLSMQQGIERVLESDEVTKLNLSDDQFYLWLARSFVDDSKDNKRYARCLTNPFNSAEIEELLI